MSEPHSVIGEPFFHFHQLDSTNSYLKREAFSLPDGTCVVADIQTAGRGRLSHQWKTQKGSLALSFLLRRPISQPEILPLQCALATISGICELYQLPLIQEGSCPLGIKWPNDILLLLPGQEAKKLCGILCEGLLCGEQQLHICGIGINMAYDQQIVDLVPYAGFLSSLGPLPGQEELAMAICKQMETILTLPFSSLRKTYQGLCVNLGRCVSFTQNNVSCCGQAVGITEQGQLLVDWEGKAVALGAGECSVEGIYGCHL